MRLPLLFDQLGQIPSVIVVESEERGELSGEEALETIATEISNACNRSSKVWLFGNGGSAAIAGHIANDIVGNELAFASSLSDIATFSAIANDHGYSEAYHRQLKLCSHSNDLVIAISSSGMSENITLAARFAKENARLLTLSGMHPGNNLRELGHTNVYIPFDAYGAIEIGHLAILHESVARVLAARSGN